MEKQATVQTIKGGYLEAMLNSCPDAVIAVNAEGTITFANKEACKLVAAEMRDIVGKSIVNIYESLEHARETNRKLFLSGGVIHDHESMAKTKTGKLVPVRISASHLKDGSGNYVGAVGYFQAYRPWPTAEAKVKARVEELEAELEEWKDLGAPVYELYPGLATIVIVGRLNADRINRVKNNLSNHMERHKTSVVRIDLSTALIDNAPAVASELLRMLRWIKLQGVETIITGVGSSLAEALEPLVGDVKSINIFGSRDLAHQAALSIIGMEIRKKD